MQASITTAPYRHHARVELAAPLAELAERVPPTVGVLEPVDDDTTMLTTGVDDLDLLAFHLLSLGVDFRVIETDDVREHLAAAAERLANAVGSTAVGSAS